MYGTTLYDRGMNDTLGPSRRQLRPMEFFILALIDRMGLKSLYAFRQEAGLEPGAIRIALQHLEEANLLERSEGGRRRCRTLTVTDEGRRVLEEDWRAQMVSHPEPEAVLRMCLVARAMAGPQDVVMYLRETALERGDLSVKKEREAEYLSKSIGSPLGAYAWMRAIVEGHRQRSEQEAFEAISHAMERVLTGERSDGGAHTRNDIK